MNGNLGKDRNHALNVKKRKTHARSVYRKYECKKHTVTLKQIGNSRKLPMSATYSTSTLVSQGHDAKLKTHEFLETVHDQRNVHPWTPHMLVQHASPNYGNAREETRYGVINVIARAGCKQPLAGKCQHGHFHRSPCQHCIFNFQASFCHTR